MATVTVNPSGRTFVCEGKQTILEAALSASIPLEYGCSSGTCGRCQARLLEGKIEKVRPHDFTIKEAERLNGHFLLCAHTAGSDVLIEALEATTSADIPLQNIQAKIKDIKKIGRDIIILSVQTPRSTRLRFLPSQNVRLTLTDEVFADLPIASCPCDDRNLEFHIRRSPHDGFSNSLFDKGLSLSSVQIEGPWGDLENNFIDAETLYLAHDTRIAAAKSLIEQQLANENENPIDLFWFIPKQDFYLSNILPAWADAFDTFKYELIFVNEAEVKPTSIDQVFSRYSTAQLSEKRVFVTGPDYFLHNAKKRFLQMGLKNEHFWAHSIKRDAEFLL